MKTANKKRSITINSYKTSVSLEREFFDGLQEIAEHEKITHEELIEQIDARRNTVNLPSDSRYSASGCPTSGRTPTLRHRPWRTRSAWVAEEAESRGLISRLVSLAPLLTEF
jgi:hypothetical protein